MCVDKLGSLSRQKTIIFYKAPSGFFLGSHQESFQPAHTALNSLVVLTIEYLHLSRQLCLSSDNRILHNMPPIMTLTLILPLWLIGR